MLKHEEDLSKAVETVMKLKDAQSLLQEKVDLFKKLSLSENADTLFSVISELTDYKRKWDYNQRFLFPFSTSQNGYSGHLCDEYVDMVFGGREYSESHA